MKKTIIFDFDGVIVNSSNIKSDNKDSFFSDINEVLFSVNQNSSVLEEKKGQVKG